MKKASKKKKETRIKMQIVEVLQQASDVKEIRMMKFLALTSYLLARIILTLMSSSTIPFVFKKSILRNLPYALI